MTDFIISLVAGFGELVDLTSTTSLFASLLT